MFNYEAFCSRLCNLREAKNYSKHEMAIQCDMSHAYYCDIENGNSIPNFRAVIAIANALNTDISRLLGTSASSENEILIISIMSKIKQVSNKSLLNQLYNIALVIKTQSGDTNERL